MGTAGAPDQRPPRRLGGTPLLLGLWALVVVAGGVGDTLSPVLVVHTPLLLLVLNPRARNVLLASRVMGSVPLLVVGLLRRLAVVPICYRLGRIHGDASLAWIDGRFPRTGRWTRRIERWFGRAAVPVILLFPGMLTSYLAGSAGMHEALVLLLAGISTLVRLIVLLAVGDAFSRPLTWLVGFIAAHQAVLLALSLVITTLQAYRLRRRFRRPAPGEVELLGEGARRRTPVP